MPAPFAAQPRDLYSHVYMIIILRYKSFGAFALRMFWECNLRALCIYRCRVFPPFRGTRGAVQQSPQVFPCQPITSFHSLEISIIEKVFRESICLCSDVPPARHIDRGGLDLTTDALCSDGACTLHCFQAFSFVVIQWASKADYLRDSVFSHLTHL